MSNASPEQTLELSDSNKSSILVVDDNEVYCNILSRRLRSRGYDTRIALDGLEALKLFEQGIRVDLVLLDLMMPNMDGLEVLKRLRETYTISEMPVIMLSAKAQSHTIVQAIEGEANDYITKPIDFPVVLSRVRAHITRKKAEEEQRNKQLRNQEILSALPGVLVLFDEAGNILEFRNHGKLPSEGSHAEAWEHWSSEASSNFLQQVEELRTGLLNEEEPKPFEFERSEDDQVHSYEARMVRCGESNSLLLLRALN